MTETFSDRSKHSSDVPLGHDVCLFALQSALLAPNSLIVEVSWLPAALGLCSNSL